jgi:hypothetical protein
MENSGPTDFDNLSKFENELKEIEGREGGVKDPAQADEVREGLISAMRGVFKSHYDLAVELDRYHKLFKAKKTATAAVERIATASGWSTRTLYRLLSNYDNARQLPLVFVDVMREQGLDPVRTANQPLVIELAAVPRPADHDEAEASLSAARAKVAKVKKPAAQATPIDVEENREAAQNLATAPETANHEEAKVSQRAVRAKVIKVKPPSQTTPNNVGEDQQAVRNLATASEPSNREEAKVPQPAARVKAPKIAPAAPTLPNDAEEFSTRIVRMFQERFGAYDGDDRDEQIRLVLERVVNVLHADVHELHINEGPDHIRAAAKTKL